MMCAFSLKNGKQFFLSFILLLLFGILLQSAQALGVAPSKKIVDFSPNASISGEIIIINNQQEDFIARIQPLGALKDLISFAALEIPISSQQAQVIVPYTIVLPEYLRGGEHLLEVMIVQEKQNADVIAAKFAVISQFIIVVPLEGIHVDASLLIGEAVPGKQIEFVLPFKNSGSQDLSSVLVALEIVEGGEVIGIAQGGITTLLSSESRKVTLYWQAPQRKAKLTARATVQYANREMVLERDFLLGRPELFLTEFILESFSLGDPALARAFIYNDWFEPAKNVQVDLDITKGSQRVIFAQSPLVEIQPYSTGHTDLFFPTTNLQQGDYLLITTIRSIVTSSRAERTMSISSEGVSLGGIKTTGKAIDTSTTLSRDIFLILVIMVLVIFNIYWIRKKPPLRDNNRDAQHVDNKQSTFSNTTNTTQKEFQTINLSQQEK